MVEHPVIVNACCDNKGQDEERSEDVDDNHVEHKLVTRYGQ